MQDNLNDMHMDVLREIGNIGAGNATTALSQMLNKSITMQVPEVNIVEFKNVSAIIGGEENIVAGILVKISGDIEGIMMYVLEYDSVRSMLNILLNKNIASEDILGEMDLSALKEIGNILTGSYLTALSKLTNLTMIQSIPKLAFDMAGAILSVPAILFGKTCDSVLFIKTDFNQGDRDVVGYYILIPEAQSFDKIMKSLGVI
ncbi:MAG TPA: CheY-P-specific phosphatase CheC [Clostridiales bacterium]|nr:MAG: CheY-P-specific phosphatase CheC [Clostridiales bacterium GWD2_32_59]HAN10587.1 CheY-P-specific phosphatase CheC [Clostridiales bacterium]